MSPSEWMMDESGPTKGFKSIYIFTCNLNLYIWMRIDLIHSSDKGDVKVIERRGQIGVPTMKRTCGGCHINAT